LNGNGAFLALGDGDENERSGVGSDKKKCVAEKFTRMIVEFEIG